jgi:hypothetical protein
MHPLIQSDLAVMHQAELLRSVETDHLISHLKSSAERRAQWLPTGVHLALFRLRLRRKAHRLRLARRRYTISWRAEVRRLLDDV